MNRPLRFDTYAPDFTIYCLLNYNQIRIKKSHSKKDFYNLENAFSKHENITTINSNRWRNEANDKLIQGLEKDALTSADELNKNIKYTLSGQTYLSVEAHKDEIKKIAKINLQVFNDPDNFFSPYYG